MELFSPGHLIPLLIVVAILFFGWKQLPDMARSVGRSLRIFKTEMKGMNEDDAAREGRDPVPPAGTSTPPSATVPPAAVPVAPLSAPAAPVPPATVPSAPAPVPSSTTVPSAQARPDLDPASNPSVENHKPATG